MMLLATTAELELPAVEATVKYQNLPDNNPVGADVGLVVAVVPVAAEVPL